MGKSSAYNKVRKVHTQWCKNCEEQNGKKDIDECFNCPIHKLFNEIYVELNGK